MAPTPPDSMTYIKNPIPAIRLFSKKNHPSELNTQPLRETFAQLNERDQARIISGYEGDPQWLAVVSQVNESRNRYCNVFPWDRTRIKLPVKSKNFLDYINASTISINDDTYIACQGPLPNTISHFWLMCFDQAKNTDVIIIVMVTPLQESGMLKCEKYWPEVNMELDLSQQLVADNIDIPSLKVCNQSEVYNGNYLLTTLKLSSGNSTKTVYHYYYDKWADTKAPTNMDELISISHDVDLVKQSSPNKPIPIVHCSAGVGRTGTFIAVDQLVHNKGDFVSIVDQMRNGRMMMVQTIHQLEFIRKVKLYLSQQS